MKINEIIKNLTIPVVFLAALVAILKFGFVDANEYTSTKHSLTTDIDKLKKNVETVTTDLDKTQKTVTTDLDEFQKTFTTNLNRIEAILDRTAKIQGEPIDAHEQRESLEKQFKAGNLNQVGKDYLLKNLPSFAQ